jgi:hypothetical protein
MSAVKTGDNEDHGRRQKKGLLADILWILETKKPLSGCLDREEVDIP